MTDNISLYLKMSLLIKLLEDNIIQQVKEHLDNGFDKILFFYQNEANDLMDILNNREIKKIMIQQFNTEELCKKIENYIISDITNQYTNKILKSKLYLFKKNDI